MKNLKASAMPSSKPDWPKSVKVEKPPRLTCNLFPAIEFRVTFFFRQKKNAESVSGGTLLRQ